MAHDRVDEAVGAGDPYRLSPTMLSSLPVCFHFIERLWRSLECEAISLPEIAEASRPGARSAIGLSFATPRGRTRRWMEGPRPRPAGARHLPA